MNNEKNSSKPATTDMKFLSKCIRMQLFSKENLGITDKQIVQMYEKGKKLYDAGKYKDAETVFSTLLVVDKKNPAYLYGLASCAMMLKNDLIAVDSFLKYANFVPSDPMPHFYISRIYEKKNDLASTLIALEMAINSAGNQPQYQAVKNRAQMSVATISKVLAEKEKADKATKNSKVEGTISSL